MYIYTCILFYFLSEVVVRWDNLTRKCEPDVCSGSNLLEVPGYDGFITKDIVEDVVIYDTSRTRQCFQNKYIVLIGDSTVSELTHDLIILLNRLATDNDTAFNRYLDCCVSHNNIQACANIEDRSTNSTMELNHVFKRYLLEGNSKLQLDGYHGHRNMTFAMPDFNIWIRQEVQFSFPTVFSRRIHINTWISIDIGLTGIRTWVVILVVSPTC